MIIFTKYWHTREQRASNSDSLSGLRFSFFFFVKDSNWLCRIKISSKHCSVKALGGTLISLSGLFPAIMLLPSMRVLKTHRQASGRASLQQPSAKRRCVEPLMFRSVDLQWETKSTKCNKFNFYTVLLKETYVWNWSEASPLCSKHSHTHIHHRTHTHTVPLAAWFKHNLKCWQALVLGRLSGRIHPPCHCLLKAQCKCQRNIVIHRALLITHCISMHYLHQA